MELVKPPEIIDELHEWDPEKVAEALDTFAKRTAILPVCSPCRGREFAIFDRKPGKQIGGGFRTR